MMKKSCGVEEVGRKTSPNTFVALQSMEHAWSPAAKAHLDTLRLETDALGLLYGEIMRLLPDFRSYDNPIAYMQAQDYAMEGAELQLYTTRVKSRLAQTDGNPKRGPSRQNVTHGRTRRAAHHVCRSCRMGGGDFGHCPWGDCDRSIVQPMKELKRALLHMGQVCFPTESEGHFGRDWRHGSCRQSLGGGIGHAHNAFHKRWVAAILTPLRATERRRCLGQSTPADAQFTGGQRTRIGGKGGGTH